MRASPANKGMDERTGEARTRTRTRCAELQNIHAQQQPALLLFVLLDTLTLPAVEPEVGAVDVDPGESIRRFLMSLQQESKRSKEASA